MNQLTEPVNCAGLGLKLVIVVGHQVQIDERLAQMGHPSTFVGGYRVTDAMALRAAVESSGLTRMQVCPSGHAERSPAGAHQLLLNMMILLELQ